MYRRKVKDKVCVRNMYYNPKCDFNSASDEIAKEFMEFVDYRENFN